jgi:hypothetical protein
MFKQLKNRRSMKNIKFLALLLGIVTLASCGDDFEKRSPSPEANSGSHKVYFPEQISGTIVMSIEETSIEIPIAREVSTGALTVNLIKTFGDGAFTIPASVSFADGETETSFTLSVGDVELMKKYQVILEFDKSQTDNPYITSDNTPMLSLNIVKEDFAPYALGAYWPAWFEYEEYILAEMEYSPATDQYRIKVSGEWDDDGDIAVVKFDAYFKWGGLDSTAVTMAGGVNFGNVSGVPAMGYYLGDTYRYGGTDYDVKIFYDGPEGYVGDFEYDKDEEYFTFGYRLALTTTLGFGINEDYYEIIEVY